MVVNRVGRIISGLLTAIYKNKYTNWLFNITSFFYFAVVAMLFIANMTDAYIMISILYFVSIFLVSLLHNTIQLHIFNNLMNICTVYERRKAAALCEILGPLLFMIVSFICSFLIDEKSPTILILFLFVFTLIFSIFSKKFKNLIPYSEVAVLNKSLYKYSSNKNDNGLIPVLTYQYINYKCSV